MHFQNSQHPYHEYTVYSSNIDQVDKMGISVHKVASNCPCLNYLPGPGGHILGSDRVILRSRIMLYQNIRSYYIYKTRTDTGGNSLPMFVGEFPWPSSSSSDGDVPLCRRLDFSLSVARATPWNGTGTLQMTILRMEQPVWMKIEKHKSFHWWPLKLK